VKEGSKSFSLAKRGRAPGVRAYYDTAGLDLGTDEVIADNFAGGGGASTGIELGLGRSPDLAVNHDPEAIAMHAANHPDTEHKITSVWEVDPVTATRGCPVALAWFSPDCKHHSKAKGGKPREQKIRGLAWVAVSWAQRVKPRVIALENVEEFEHWGPLHRAGKLAGQPIKERRGETFRAFVRKLERLGYVVEWRLLRASDYGAPTTRRRLFLIARCDGKPVHWPDPTHGPGRAQPHRTAAEIIDWTIACPSIFERERALAEKTGARLARGVVKFAIEPSARGARPFVIPTAHGGVGRRDHRVHDVLDPLRTVTGSRRGDHAIAVPYLVHRSNGERPGQAPRIYDPQEPVRTVVAQGQKHAACVAWLVKHHGAHESAAGGTPLSRSIDTVTATDAHSLATVHIAKYYGTSTGSAADAPVPAVTAGGDRGGVKFTQLMGFLAKYNRTGTAESVETPVDTLTSRDRYAVANVTAESPPLDAATLAKARRVAAFLRAHGHDVGEVAEVVVDGETYVVVDIGMRMLTPRELFRAQGFPEDYQIAPVYNGKPLTKTAQIRMCGNSVCPPLAAAIVRAQFVQNKNQLQEAA